MFGSRNEDYFLKLEIKYSFYKTMDFELTLFFMKET